MESCLGKKCCGYFRPAQASKKINTCNEDALRGCGNVQRGKGRAIAHTVIATAFYVSCLYIFQERQERTQLLLPQRPRRTFVDHWEVRRRKLLCVYRSWTQRGRLCDQFWNSSEYDTLGAWYRSWRVAGCRVQLRLKVLASRVS